MLDACLNIDISKSYSNLLKQISEPACSNIFPKYAEIINNFDETYIESRIGAQQNEFVRLGLADSVLLQFSNNRYDRFWALFGSPEPGV